MKEYLIGIDIGTQGTKAALVDEKLRVEASAFEASRLLGGEAGVVWQEGEDLFGSCVRTIRELLEKNHIPGSRIQAIGVDSQMAGIMGIDQEGEASTCYDSWLDTRCGAYVPLLEKEAGEEILLSSGGPVTATQGAKILWWKNQRPKAYRNTAKFVLPHGYVTGKMAGNRAEKAVFDHTCLHFNSFSDNERKCWNEELLHLFGVAGDKMPRIVSPFEIVGTVSRQFAELTGLKAGIPIAAGLGDSAASTFGSGMFEKGRVLDCAGTASILCSVVDSYVPDQKNRTLVMMRSPEEGIWFPLSYIGGGGMCIRWVKNQLTGSESMSYEELEKEAEKVTPGCNGLLFNPHFSGRVLPPAPTMKGAYLGLDFNHSRGHMYRSVMEGIAYEYAIYLSILRENYPQEHFHKIDIVGGGARSDLFNQIKADVLNMEVETFEMGETALVGSAAVAGIAVGMVKDYRKMISGSVERKKRYVPNPENREIYCAKIRQYRKMLEKMEEWKMRSDDL